MSAVRYPAKVMARAVEHREAGWPCPKVCELLEREFGVRPSDAQVWRWTNSRRVEALRQREYSRRSRTTRPASEGYRLARMRELRDAGLSFRSGGVVAGVWWGEALGEDQVRARLKDAA